MLRILLLICVLTCFTGKLAQGQCNIKKALYIGGMYYVDHRNETTTLWYGYYDKHLRINIADTLIQIDSCIYKGKKYHANYVGGKIVLTPLIKSKRRNRKLFQILIPATPQQLEEFLEYVNYIN